VKPGKLGHQATGKRWVMPTSKKSSRSGSVGTVASPACAALVMERSSSTFVGMKSLP